MKVLEHGQAWSLETECTGEGNGDGGCHARLEVEEADLYQTYASHMGRDESFYITFKCPLCDAETDIPDKLVPVRTQAKLRAVWEAIQRTRNPIHHQQEDAVEQER